MISSNTLRDQVRLASNPARLRKPAFQVINALQQAGVTPGEQILAAGISFIAMCESTGLDFSEVVAKCVRLLAPTEGPFTAHVQAVRDYAVNELRKGGV
jgi:hypothetical protein